MGPVLVVFHLRPMALGAKRHDVCEFNSLSVRQFQSVVVVRVVTGQTTDLAMRKFEPTMKFIQIGDTLVLKIGIPSGMARRTGNRHSLAMHVGQAGQDSRWPLWRPYRHRERFLSRRFFQFALNFRAVVRVSNQVFAPVAQNQPNQNTTHDNSSRNHDPVGNP